MKITNRTTLYGKVQRVPLKDSSGWQFLIVHNYREPREMGGKQTCKMIKNVLYARDEQLNDDFFRVAAWMKINETLAKMHAEGMLSREDMKRAKEKFSAKLPRPMPQAFKPLRSGKIDLSKYSNILK